MNVRIENISPKMLVGKRMQMSMSNNKTSELWRSFMPERNKINNIVGNSLYSLQMLDPLYFVNFNPDTEFEKWAAAEVSDIIDSIPNSMEVLTLLGGLYAVFHYVGAANEGYKAFQYIFGTWLPNSEYVVDNRPHFELLGEKYKHNDPTSEEEIWIPISPKS